MADYRGAPLKITARSRGGADVDVSATLFVDDKTDQSGDVTLVDTHLAMRSAELKAIGAGDTKLRLLYVVVPLVGNGEFTVSVTVEHPNIPNSPVTIEKTGNVSELSVFRNTYKLP